MKKKHIVFIVIGLLIISLIVLLIMFFKSDEYNDYSGPIDDEYFESNGIIDEAMDKKHTEKSYVLPSGEILVEVTNNNKYGADAYVYIIYYDESNNKIKEDKSILTINPKSKGYTIFYNYDEKFKYDRYEVKVNLKYAYGMAFYNNCIVAKGLNKKDFYLYIEYTNKCSTTIKSAEIGVLFYDNKDNIIGYSSTYSDVALKKNKKIKGYVLIPDNGDYGDISYDKYKVIVNEAYNW